MSTAKNNIIDGTVNSLGDIGNSDTLATYGFTIGTFINIIWIGLGVYLINEKNHIDILKSEKWHTQYLPSILLFLTVIGDIIYYNYSKQNEKDKNTYYANISLAPIYITIVVFLMLILMSAR
jgi:hypothetical protein